MIVLCTKMESSSLYSMKNSSRSLVDVVETLGVDIFSCEKYSPRWHETLEDAHGKIWKMPATDKHDVKNLNENYKFIHLMPTR